VKRWLRKNSKRKVRETKSRIKSANKLEQVEAVKKGYFCAPFHLQHGRQGKRFRKREVLVGNRGQKRAVHLCCDVDDQGKVGSNVSREI